MFVYLVSEVKSRNDDKTCVSRDSNPGRNLGRVASYPWTTDAAVVVRSPLRQSNGRKITGTSFDDRAETTSVCSNGARICIWHGKEGGTVKTKSVATKALGEMIPRLTGCRVLVSS